MRYRFEHSEEETTPYTDLATEKIVMETDGQSLDILLDVFERFLRASGFVINGSLDIVEQDIPSDAWTSLLGTVEVDNSEMAGPDANPDSAF